MEAMAVPEFHRFFRPVLAFFADGGVSKHWRECIAPITAQFNLSESDTREMIPSNVRTRVEDRILWSITHLRQAQLLKSTGRGINCITDRGKQYLLAKPVAITQADLMAFVEYQKFVRPNSINNATTALPNLLPPPPNTTPEEAMAIGYKEWTTALADEVRTQLLSVSPARFERLIVQLMLKLGYGGASDDAGVVLGRTNDQGVDGVISEDKLGLDKIYLQAKRYTTQSVGREHLQAFTGALAGQGATKGVFITTSTFTTHAKQYVQTLPNFKIVLIDGEELARLMISYDLGVVTERRYELKRMDSDFFTEL